MAAARIFGREMKIKAFIAPGLVLLEITGESAHSGKFDSPGFVLPGKYADRRVVIIAFGIIIAALIQDAGSDTAPNDLRADAPLCR
jgi:hypothetical protein